MIYLCGQSFVLIFMSFSEDNNHFFRLSLPILMLMSACAGLQLLWILQWSPWRNAPGKRNRPPHWMRDVVIPSREAWLRTQGEFTMARSTSPLFR